jgi:hypothetical protein
MNDLELERFIRNYATAEGKRMQIMLPEEPTLGDEYMPSGEMDAKMQKMFAAFASGELAEEQLKKQLAPKRCVKKKVCKVAALVATFAILMTGVGVMASKSSSFHFYDKNFWVLPAESAAPESGLSPNVPANQAVLALCRGGYLPSWMPEGYTAEAANTFVSLRVLYRNGAGESIRYGCHKGDSFYDNEVEVRESFEDGNGIEYCYMEKLLATGDMEYGLVWTADGYVFSLYATAEQKDILLRIAQSISLVA